MSTRTHNWQPDIDSNTSSIISVRNLAVQFSTSYGTVYAVRELSLDIPSHSTVALVGESGSGKSVATLSILNLLPRNATIASGAIMYNNQDILRMSASELTALRGNDITAIFQEPSLSFDPLYTIGKLLAESLSTHHPHMTKQEIEYRSLELLTEIQLPNPKQRLKNYPHQFSGGQLQRISIALALSSNPKVLIADEPTTALDVTTQSQIIDLLMTIQQRRALTIIFISHDINLVTAIADSIAVLYAGYLVEYAPTTEIIASPRHPYTRALLDATVSMGAHYKTDVLQSISGNPPSPYQLYTSCPYQPRCPLARQQCTTAVPPLIKHRSMYRCVVDGVKTTNTTPSSKDQA